MNSAGSRCRCGGGNEDTTGAVRGVKRVTRGSSSSSEDKRRQRMSESSIVTALRTRSDACNGCAQISKNASSYRRCMESS